MADRNDSDVVIKLKKQIRKSNVLEQQRNEARALAEAYQALLRAHNIPLGHEGLKTRREQMETAKQIAVATGKSIRVDDLFNKIAA